MRRLLDELHRLGAIDADRFAREFGTQLIVERVVSQLVDLAAGVNAHVVVESGGGPADVRRSFAAVVPISASSTATSLNDSRRPPG